MERDPSWLPHPGQEIEDRTVGPSESNLVCAVPELDVGGNVGLAPADMYFSTIVPCSSNSFATSETNLAAIRFASS